jgi:hypothetical protein
MSQFDINSVVFHLDDFDYGRRLQPYFFLTNATQLFFSKVIILYQIHVLLMCFKSFLLHKLICIVYLLKYLNTNVTVAFYMCRPSLLLFG